LVFKLQICFFADLRGRSDGAKSAELHSNKGKLPVIIAVRKRKYGAFSRLGSPSGTVIFAKFFATLPCKMFNYQLTETFALCST
jgi:hypothetical protein